MLAHYKKKTDQRCCQVFIFLFHLTYTLTYFKSAFSRTIPQTSHVKILFDNRKKKLQESFVMEFRLPGVCLSLRKGKKKKNSI
jgi:hypothetical protein